MKYRLKGDPSVVCVIATELTTWVMIDVRGACITMPKWFFELSWEPVPVEEPPPAPIEERLNLAAIQAKQSPAGFAEKPEPPVEECRGCRFCAADDNSDSWFCRRHPPDAKNGIPIVSPHGWCGEFEAKK